MPLMDQRLMDDAALWLVGPSVFLLFVFPHVPGLAGCLLSS